MFPSSMVPGSVTTTLHPLATPDATAARELALAVFADAPYSDLMLGALDSALEGTTNEYQVIAASDDSGVAGIIVFGETPGACGAGCIHLIAVDGKARRHGVASALIDAACARLAEQGVRFAMIELPADARLAPARALAQRAGFREETRVDDYVRDGIALVFLRRDQL
jgi:ribosomal protein S18 acetylase RimI-like enzyme